MKLIAILTFECRSVLKPKSQRPSVDDSSKPVSSPKSSKVKEGSSHRKAHEPPPAKKRKRSQSADVDETSDEDFDASKLADDDDDGSSDEGSASDDWQPAEVVPVAKPSSKTKKEPSKKVRLQLCRTHAKRI